MIAGGVLAGAKIPCQAMTSKPAGPQLATGGNLDVEVLIRGADAGVADGGPGLGLNQDTMPPQNSEINPIETRFLSRVDDSLGYTRVRQGITLGRGSLGRCPLVAARPSRTDNGG